MRALAVFHLGGIGGPQLSLLPAMRWLAFHGTVEFIVPESGPTEAEYRTLGPVSVHDYSTLFYPRTLRERAKMARRLLRDLRMFRRELRRRRPDVVVVVTTTLPALLLAARLERIPTVVYAAELYDQKWKAAPFIRMWGSLLATGTAILADGVVCCSRTVARQFPRWVATPVAVAYPPVGVEYEGGDADRTRARYRVRSARPCVAVVGNLSRGRGQDVMLRALPRLRREFPAVQLMVVGAPHPRPVDRAFAEELRGLARELAVEDAVVYVDPAMSGVGPSAMADTYAAADIVVNPARVAESFGRVLPEALVAGKPVVASRVGAIPEVIRDQVDGLLVPPDNPDALAEAIARLLKNPLLAQRLVDSGRRHVQERCGREPGVATWQRTMTQALRRRGVSTPGELT